MEVNNFFEIKRILRPYLSEYRKTDEILNHLKSFGIELNSRQFQAYVDLYNQEYVNRELYLVGTNKGYKLTYDKKEIVSSNMQKIKKAVSMIRNAKRDLSELSTKDQLTFMESECSKLDNFADTYEIVEQKSLFEGGLFY